MANHRVRILWGESPEPDDTPKTYEFDTEAELNAFRTGVEEAAGWLGYAEVDPEEETADVA